MAYTDIDKSDDYFNTVLYTGNGSARTITGVGFQPDWVWVKDRSSTNYHYLYDSVRGNNLNLFSNDASAEVNVTTGQNGGGIGSQASDGFNIVSGLVGTNNVNTNNNLYASWSWLAGGTASSNTDGSITSSVSASTTSGFSVGTYSGNSTTGATVGHGLGSAPSMVIVKKTSGTGDWYVYHSGIGATKFIKLNDTAASATNALWNNTAPTSSVFSMDSNSAVNGSGDSYVFYAFAEKQGFSKFGSYTGNGSADGTFVYTGFKPAWVLVKNTSGSGDNWILVDNKRLGYNPDNRLLFPNENNADYTNNNLDLLSNGFKARVSYDPNGSGNTMIYMAFAENPLVGTNNIPATAR